jgi:hypothetical protein
MGYFPVPGGGSGTDHQHANKAVLDALQNAGSGTVITEAERASLDGAFTTPPGTEAIWEGSPPETLGEAVSKLAVLLAKHLGTLTELNP